MFKVAKKTKKVLNQVFPVLTGLINKTIKNLDNVFQWYILTNFNSIQYYIMHNILIFIKKYLYYKCKVLQSVLWLLIQYLSSIVLINPTKILKVQGPVNDG